MGLVSPGLQRTEIAKLPGTRAIGHVRYSTTGSSTLKNAQPLIADCARGQLAVGHNGNLVNATLLRDELEARARSSKPRSTARSSFISWRSRSLGDSGLFPALRQVKGAFSLVMMSEREIIGVRDPFGFRPLCLGKLDGAWLLSRESAPST